MNYGWFGDGCTAVVIPDGSIQILLSQWNDKNAGCNSQQTYCDLFKMVKCLTYMCLIEEAWAGTTNANNLKMFSWHNMFSHSCEPVRSVLIYLATLIPSPHPHSWLPIRDQARRRKLGPILGVFREGQLPADLQPEGIPMWMKDSRLKATSLSPPTYSSPASGNRSLGQW